MPIYLIDCPTLQRVCRQTMLVPDRRPALSQSLSSLIFFTMLTLGFTVPFPPSSAATENQRRPATLFFAGPQSNYVSDVATNLANITSAGLHYTAYPASLLGGISSLITAPPGQEEDTIHILALNSALLAKTIPEFEVLTLPFLLLNPIQARVISARIDQPLAAAAKRASLKILGYSWNVSAFASATNCVENAQDLKDKMIIGGLPSHQELFALVGAKHVSEQSYGAKVALQIGRADVGVFPISFLQDEAVASSLQCLTDPTSVAAMIVPYVLAMQADRWNALDSNEKDLVEAAIATFENVSDNYVQEKISSVKKQFAHKWRELSPVDRKKAVGSWRHLAQEIYKKFQETYSEFDIAELKAIEFD